MEFFRYAGTDVEDDRSETAFEIQRGEGGAKAKCVVSWRCLFRLFLLGIIVINISRCRVFVGEAIG